MKQQREFRMSAKAQVRAKQGSAQPVIEGYAAVFNSLSEDLGGFREVVKPGAFKNSLANGNDVRALVNHDPNLVIGRSKSSTLRLAEDSTGLHFECDLPDTSAARDLMTSVNRGDIDQCSFGFYVVNRNWVYMDDPSDEEGDSTLIVRELLDVDLFDVSVVTYPAYTDTTAGMRGLPAAEEIAQAIADLQRNRPVSDEERDRMKRRLRLLEVSQ